MAAGIHLPGSDETIELQQQVARLQALLEASRQVHSTIREEEVLEQTLRIVVRELEMAGAAFPSEGLAYGNVKNLNLGDGSGSGQPIYLLQDREGRRMTELVVAPPDGRELTLYEADFLEGLALQTAVALENARNHERNLQWARVQQDLDAARNIQRSLLPQSLPEISGYSVAYRSVTCYEVGGDYLDIVEQPDGGVLMVVADVAGKGMASAIMSTSFRAAFRAIASTGLPLDELGARMNQHHWAEGEEARCDGDFYAAESGAGRAGSGECRAQSGVSARAGRGNRAVRIDGNAAGHAARHALLHREMRVYTGSEAALLHRRID
jgi:hypothetical protein